jgi:carbon storage regulator
MLVLSRKIGEQITIGNSVKVTVLSFDRGIVRLGIEAPKSIPVHRKEVHDKIVETNKAASQTDILSFRNAISSKNVNLANSINKNSIDTPTLIRKNIKSEEEK